MKTTTTTKKRARIARQVARSLGAEPGTPEFKRRVKAFNEMPAHSLAYALAEAVGGKPGSAGHSRALDVLTNKPTPKKRKLERGVWWGVFNVTGDDAAWPNLARNEGDQVRTLTARYLTAKLGYEVKPEYVMPHWVPEGSEP